MHHFKSHALTAHAPQHTASHAPRRALYGKQIGALLGGVAQKNLPGLRNLAMELRKVRGVRTVREGNPTVA